MSTEPKMPSDEELNVAIAAVVGFSWTPWGKTHVRLFFPESGYIPDGWSKPEGRSVIWPCGGRTVDETAMKLLAQIPFVSDLNAMHEAEKGLTDEEHEIFRRWLFVDAYGREGMTNESAERERVSASARQRAIALLRIVRPELFQ